MGERLRNIKSRWSESNRRQDAYEASTLPLSYTGLLLVYYLLIYETATMPLSYTGLMIASSMF